MVNKGLL